MSNMLVSMQHFSYAHLPEPLQEISAKIGDIAHYVNNTMPTSAEQQAGLRKLLEAKDCLVRARLDMLRNEKEFGPPRRPLKRD